MAPAQQVIKKLKMNHLGLYTLHVLSHSRPQLLQSVKKKKNNKKNKGGMPVTELLNASTQ